jgi:hypothetical protein
LCSTSDWSKEKNRTVTNLQLSLVEKSGAGRALALCTGPIIDLIDFRYTQDALHGAAPAAAIAFGKSRRLIFFAFISLPVHASHLELPSPFCAGLFASKLLLDRINGA